MPTKAPKLPDICATHTTALSGVDHALAFLDELLAKPRYPIPRGETPIYMQMRRDLPYVLHATNRSGVQILVNRNYKPLGNSSRTSEDWVDYEAFTNMHVRLSDREIALVCAPDRDRSLFGDGNPPWNGKRDAKAYRERLLKLRSLVAGHGAA